MTFAEKIYRQINEITGLTTDEYSTEWLKQSRSYHSSLKAQNREASLAVLQSLLSVITRKQNAALKIASERNSERLKASAKIYQALALEIASEIANRNLEDAASKHNNLGVRKLVLEALSRSITEQLNSDEQEHGLAPVVMI